MKFRIGLVGSNRRQSSGHFAPSPRQAGGGGARTELIRTVMLVGSIFFGGLFPVVHAVADPPRYRIIVIDLPGGVPEPTHMNPDMGINNRGEAVCTLHDGTNTYRPIVWLPATHYGRDPGSSALTPGSEGFGYSAVDMNVNGIAVGLATDVDPLYVDCSYYWDLNTNTSGIIEVSTDLSNIRKEQAFAVNDNDPPMVVGQTWATDPEDPETQVNYGYRKVLGDGHDLFDFFYTDHVYARPFAVADSGFAAGVSNSNYPSCGQQQDIYRSVTWPASGTGIISPDNLVTLGTAQAEAFTVPQGVNNASPNMIVGYGRDPNDLVQPCRERGLFWSNPSTTPTILPYLTVNGQPVPDSMRASAIADPRPDGTLLAVGSVPLTNVAVLWRRINGVWEAFKLKDMTPCGSDQWTSFHAAVDINDCGWIVGYGTMTDGKKRGFVLVPRDTCPGDIGGSIMYPNGVVDIDDLLTVVNAWGSTTNCVADITGDGSVNIDDLLAVINSWGPCSCFPTQTAGPSFSQTLSNAGLAMSDWNFFVDVMANGTESDKENHNCWMQRYLTGCVRCPSCPSKDPFEN